MSTTKSIETGVEGQNELSDKQRDAIEYAVKNEWELGTILSALL